MLNPRDAWQATLGQLQLQLNRATFDTWLKGAELATYEDGEFVIRVRHAYAKDWLEKHLDHMITVTLGNIYGRSVDVRYIVHVPARRVLEDNEESNVGPLFTQPAAGQSSSDETSSAAVKSSAATSTSKRTARAAKQSRAKAIAPQAEAEEKRASSAVEQAIDIVEKAASSVQPGGESERSTTEQDKIADYSEWDPRVSNIQPSRPVTAEDLPEVTLNSRYTFEAFVPGPNNQFAFAAAEAIAQGDTSAFNPLYIYGGVGMGKTHLLQAIGHKALEQGRRVAYISGETFVNEMVAAIRSRTMDAFRARYRQADLLLVDDVQFLAGKTSSEEEFYHTFNAVFNHNGQIVMTGDRLPIKLTTLDDRIKSRIEGGLMADLQPPEFETRMKILERKSAAQGRLLPEDVARTLAQHNITNVRELEGLLNQVIARASLTSHALTSDLARQVLNRTSPQPTTTRRSANLEQILEKTATYHQLSMDDLMGPRRTKAVVRARHIAIYLAREETESSLPQIGEALGGRNHSTVLHGYKKIAGEVASDADLRREVGLIRQQIYLQ